MEGGREGEREGGSRAEGGTEGCSSTYSILTMIHTSPIIPHRSQVKKAIYNSIHAPTELSLHFKTGALCNRHMMDLYLVSVSNFFLTSPAYYWMHLTVRRVMRL